MKQLTPEELDRQIAQARADYGDLVETVFVWPDGILVSLIGGEELITYLPDGSRSTTWEPRRRDILFGHLGRWWRLATGK